MKLLERFLKVKTLVTLLLTGVVCYKAINGDMDIRDIYFTVICFYFGTQSEKKEGV